MSRRGDVWISAVIYIALGIIAMTLVIAAGVPLINKIRDRNTFQQTKEVMSILDNAIQEVLAEGPGSRRFLSPVFIKEGTLYVRGLPVTGGNNFIVWTMETKALLLEPNKVIKEGNLKLGLSEHPILADTYIANITLDYFNDREIELDVADEDKRPIEGKNSIVVTNLGVDKEVHDQIKIRIDIR